MSYAHKGSTRHVSTGTRSAWAFAIHLDEVVLARLVDARIGGDEVKAYVFRITANRIFWPHMPDRTFNIPRSLILRVLPREYEPPCIPNIFEARRNGRVEIPGPISLSHSAWSLFMDSRNAYHARIRERSLAVRKLDRRMQRLKESRARAR